MTRRSIRPVATVATGAATAATRPGMVIISPAMPSETVKSAPIEVSRPIGRISVVTMAKMPIVTETTASQPVSGVRTGVGGEVRTVDTPPVQQRAGR